MVKIDKNSWETGYRAGLDRKDNTPPPDVDDLSFFSGFIDGKAERGKSAPSKPKARWLNR